LKEDKNTSDKKLIGNLKGILSADKNIKKQTRNDTLSKGRKNKTMKVEVSLKNSNKKTKVALNSPRQPEKPRAISTHRSH